jgi:hypothetical protein
MLTSARRVLVTLLLAFSLGTSGVFVTDGFAADQKKTVHVKEYKRKDGTVVKAHDRKAPEAQSKTAGTASTGSTSSDSHRERTAAVPTASVARDANGRIHRSDAARRAFLRQTGYEHGRPGYIVDHIVPLACGGADNPSNMQWQTIAEAKAKDRTERVGCQ